MGDMGEPCGDRVGIKGDLGPGTLEVINVTRKKYGGFKQIEEERLWRER